MRFAFAPLALLPFLACQPSTVILVNITPDGGAVDSVTTDATGATDVQTASDANDATVETGVDADRLLDASPPIDMLAMDAPDDVPADAPLEVLSDVAVDMALDSPARDSTSSDTADAEPSCSGSAFRCNAAGSVERCTAGAWTLQTSCNTLTSSTRETCSDSACVLCAIPDGGGAGCGALCTTDGECHDLERARCVDGHCARRGWVRCSTNPDCVGFSQGMGLTGCADGPTIDGVVVRTCGGRRVNGNCTSDAMCPRDMHCDTPSGFCTR